METEPKLEAPGAGLPFFEALVLRYYVKPFVMKKFSWDQSMSFLKSEGEKILILIGDVSDEDANKKILVQRIRGLEDSSRYWSIAMVLEHILIVTNAIRSVILDLSNQKKTLVFVDIAKVKPKGGKPWQELKAEFKQMMQSEIGGLSSLARDKNSKLSHEHPWFGQMNTKEWAFLIGAHLRIHRQQVKQIVDQLK
ncbi:MAG: DinB family protein [Bacteriovoracia bacterium]